MHFPTIDDIWDQIAGVSKKTRSLVQFISDQFAFQTALDLAGKDELSDFLKVGPEFIEDSDRIRNEAIIARRSAEMPNQVTPGLDVFEGKTVTLEIPLAGENDIASFEPDVLELPPDSGTAEEIETTEPMPVPVVGAAAKFIFPLLTGTAFGVGTFLGDALMGILGTSDNGGTSVAPPAPSTTPGMVDDFIDVGGAAVGGFNGVGRPTIATMRGDILRQIGARHGRKSFSYNVARRILRDLGEVAGAACLGITGGQACFLLIHPPKRRGRQITPKQINRAMGAYKRVKALNQSVRKTLGPGCKL